ncbi:MAG: hypothetical protein BWY66_01559 [bacterium ADurb.Bin374]|nr:MAG: hypothetical protein BWY66_01559 [bacterium ADurb.Bin374]
MGDGLADTAHAENAEVFTGKVEAELDVGFPALEEAVAKQLFRFAHAAHRHQNENERRVGGGIGQHVRRVRHDDAGTGRRDQVDVVEADRVVRDGAQMARLPDDSRIEGVGQQRNDPVGFSQGGLELFIRPVGIEHPDGVAGLFEQLDGSSRNRTRNDDLHRIFPS